MTAMRVVQVCILLSVLAVVVVDVVHRDAAAAAIMATGFGVLLGVMVESRD